MRLTHSNLFNMLLSSEPNSSKKYVLKQKFVGEFAFIHINKCGGTSVESALKLPIKIHDTALQRRTLLGKRRWEQLFTFSIVRNPYDKVASHYRYRVKTNQTGLGDRHLDLNDWVCRAFGDQDPTYYDQPLMFAPCTTWLSDETGEIIVDYVAKLESIDRDWQTIKERLGLTVDLPQHNATSSKADSRNELSSEALEIIQSHFAEDFEHFGYDA